ILELLRALAKKNHTRARIVARAPVEITIVAANCLGQAERWTIVIDGAGLAVVPGQNRATLALALRQAAVDLSDGGSELLPAEHVRIVLRPACRGVALGLHVACVRKSV